MSDVAENRIRATLQDLARLRDQGRAVELIDGEIVYKASPLPEHGRAQRKLGVAVDPFDRGAGGPRGPGGWWLMTEVEVFYQAGVHVIVRAEPFERIEMAIADIFGTD